MVASQATLQRPEPVEAKMLALCLTLRGLDSARTCRMMGLEAMGMLSVLLTPVLQLLARPATHPFIKADLLVT